MPEFLPVSDEFFKEKLDRIIRRVQEEAEEDLCLRQQVQEEAVLDLPFNSSASGIEEWSLQSSTSQEEQESRYAANELNDFTEEQIYAARIAREDFRFRDLVSLRNRIPLSTPNRKINALPIQEAPSTSSPPEKTSKKAQKSLPMKKAGVMFGGLKQITTIASIDPPLGACFNYWEKDHNRRQCPLPSQGEFCANCGRRGVILNTCPRCSEVHIRDMATAFGPHALDRNQQRRNEDVAKKATEKSPDYFERSKGKISKVTQLTGSSDVRDKFPKVVKGEAKESSLGAKPKSIIKSATRTNSEPVGHPSERGLLEELRDFSLLLEGLPPEVIAQAKAEFLEERRSRFEGPSSSKKWQRLLHISAQTVGA